MWKIIVFFLLTFCAERIHVIGSPQQPQTTERGDKGL